MNITSALFEAYLKCHTKCVLRGQGERGKGNAFAEWVRTQSESYRSDGIARLKDGAAQGAFVLAPTGTEGLASAKWRFALDFVARADNLEARFHAVERVPAKGRRHAPQFITIRFVPNNALTRHDKLLLAYDALVLSELQGCEVGPGKIIHGEDRSIVTVKPSSLQTDVRTLTRNIAALLSNPSPPDLILNRHCAECEYQGRCRQKAVEKDDLSLLAGMTQKERKKHNSKGIFTVTQLSYTFRPRRRPKRLASKGERYNLALKALAIRARKVHVVGKPELAIDGTPVYLDVEGVPSGDFYYLIGVRIPTGDGFAQHSFWADDTEEESRIWRDFLGLLATVESPTLIHYGSFETAYLKHLLARYGGPANGAVADALDRPVNLLSIIYAHIYLPTYSNGLKDHARFLGFDWSEPSAAGAQALVWRCDWEKSHDPALKQKLIEYNAEDCEGLRRVADFVSALSPPRGVATEGHAVDIVRAESLPRENLYKFGKVQFRLPELEEINRAAYWDYQRDRILVKSRKQSRSLAPKPRKRAWAKPRANKTVHCAPPLRCLKCGAPKVYKHWATSKTVLDVKFSAPGIKRWVTKFLFSHYRCPDCRAVFHTSDRPWSSERFGPNLRALSVYQNIDLGLPLSKVALFLNQVLGLGLSHSAPHKFKQKAAAFFEETYATLTRRIVTGSLVHADETQVNLATNIGYVWVFTNLEDVVYAYAPSRDGDLARALLKDFRGVLVSDFYTAYESLDCPQQRCLIHLIRDLNDDLLKEPFNEEMKEIVGEFAGLVKPMIETVDRFGLKARFLRKHKGCVGRFFRRLVQRDYRTDTPLKCKKRLEKNRHSLFTFLDYDGVPWNNNNAEHAIKALVLLRRDFSGLSTEKGIREYLILLSICETCRFKGVSFLNFLRSGEKDIDAFAGSQRKKKSTPARNRPLLLG